MHIPVLLAAEVVGESTPVTVGLMISVAFLAFAWGESRSKLSQALQDISDGKDDRKSLRAKVEALELGKAATDMQLANMATTLTKMDGKMDRILEIDTQGARRRASDVAA